MFRDDRQVCDALRVLLSSLHLEHLWTESGPTKQALELLEQDGGPFSHGETLLLLAAFDFWNGQGETDFGQLLNVLDSEQMNLVASLMLACSAGPTAVDRWIAQRAESMTTAEPTDHAASESKDAKGDANGRIF